MTLYVLKYNNYFNRKVLKEDSLSSYLTAPYYNGLHIDNVSFNPNDDIKTTQVFNFEPIGDYVICTIKTVNEGVETETIQSRWFILESKRERTGQYTVVLKRDVLADSYSTVISSPMYIEKGMVKDSDPYIFNKERIALNQIKQSEVLLKDDTKCAWIVGYVPRDAFSTSTTITANMPISPSGTTPITVAGINNWQYYNYTNLSANQRQAWYLNTNNSRFWVLARRFTSAFMAYKAMFNIGGVINNDSPNRGSVRMNINEPWNWFFDGEYKSVPDKPYYYGSRENVYYASDIATACYNLLTVNDWNTIASLMSSEISNITESQLQDILALNEQVIHDSVTDIYYKITVNVDEHAVAYINSTSTPNLFNLLKTKFDGLDIWENDPSLNHDYDTACGHSFRIEPTGSNGITLTLSQYEPGQASVTLDDNRGNLVDAPYDMFFMPYGDNIKVFDGSDTFEVSKLSSLVIANAIGIALGDKLYDLQLLPYCPVNLTSIVSEGYTVINMSAVGYRDFVTVSSDKVNIVSWATSSNFTKTIEYIVDVNNKKLDSQTELYRICSPNYSNAFDFNIAMNNGVTEILVDCTYKPFDPYIHVYPKFNGLYGDDFKDQRGLVCGGDFSVAQLTTEWAQYQLNNKSFLSVFDNTVSNLTKQGSSYKDAVSTTISQIADQDLQYKLGNVFAMPSGLSKTSAMTYNNKLFPFVEHYTCTPEEKSALENKITYEGMTIGRIDTISNLLDEVYGDCFVKGRVIRLNINDKDTHYLDEIYKELMKGVYIHKEEELNE